MVHSAKNILNALLNATPSKTADAPDDARGIYGLIDHCGDLKYIGSTKSANETFRKRIHMRHRTGSEDYSHYFSRMYNTGRMWRDRGDRLTAEDGDVAKELRNAFIADHCAAVWVPVPDNLDIFGLEKEILRLAPSEAIAWNGRRTDIYVEPVELVDETLERLKWPLLKLEALDRQRQRFIGGTSAQLVTASKSRNEASNLFPSGGSSFQTS